MTGTVEEISAGVPAYIVVAPDDDSEFLEFKGIPVAYLENFLAAEFDDLIFTLLGACVEISYHKCPGLAGADAALKACSIAILDITGCASDAAATADADPIVTFELPLPAAVHLPVEATGTTPPAVAQSARAAAVYGGSPRSIDR